VAADGQVQALDGGKEQYCQVVQGYQPEGGRLDADRKTEQGQDGRGHEDQQD
jgi:hypothetical protein